MSADHQQLGLNDARAGMVLSDDVLDDHGVVLLVRGTCLTTAILSSLARHGIENVPIRIIPGSAAASEAEPDLEQQRTRLNYLFRKESCNEASSLLHQYVEHYRFGDGA